MTGSDLVVRVLQHLIRVCWQDDISTHFEVFPVFSPVFLLLSPGPLRTRARGGFVDGVPVNEEQ